MLDPSLAKQRPYARVTRACSACVQHYLGLLFVFIPQCPCFGFYSRDRTFTFGSDLKEVVSLSSSLHLPLAMVLYLRDIHLMGEIVSHVT